eukprot:scaffold17886_cov44-Cyclotella_meneghiniana.AAC.2
MRLSAFINSTDIESLYLLLILKPNVSYLDYRYIRNSTHYLWEKTNASDASDASDVEKATIDQYYHVYDDHMLTVELSDHYQEYAAHSSEKPEKIKLILGLIAKREAIVSDIFNARGAEE